MDLGDPEDRVFAAERIIKKRMKSRKTEFLVKWKGWSQRHNTWEPEENILDQRLIDSFERQQRKTLLKTSGKHKFIPEIVQKKKKTLSTLALIKRPSKESLAGSGGKSSRHEQDSDDEKPSTSGQIKIKQEIDKDMDTSDSSDDEVLCKKENAQPETKRKAEVLSKESGKIGITIKTSPPSSAVPLATAAVKEEKLKKDPEPVEKVVPDNKQVDSTTGSSETKKMKISTPKPEKPSENVSTTVHTNNKEVSSSPVPPPVKERKEDSKPSTTAPKEETAPPVMSNNRVGTPKPQEQTTQQQQHQQHPQQPPLIPEPTTPNKQSPPAPVAEPTSPYHELASPRLWLPKFNLTDQIFITDVTVNSETATIRECKTEKGFFKERTAINNQVESIPVTQP